jgi:hypothetical protein
VATDIPLMLQTVYADLLDRAKADAFADAFPADGVFTVKVVRGRRYWYFQASKANGRGQQYVGPETPELLQQIATHRAAREYQRDQRGLVATLVRSGNLPRPVPAIGDLVAGLAAAGVFRLRGVLVGTVAYQTYAAMLGVRLPVAMVETNDIDVAQFADMSAALDDTTRPMAEILREVDASFRPVPHIDPQRAASYIAASGLRVDFLTPNRGRDTEHPQKLPALGTDAQPLRFLDFLIREPEPAVLLHGAGVLVSVPAPQRYALHNLIVARRRRKGDPKREKDLLQAQGLLDALVRRRPHELRAAWDEAFSRRKTWRRLLGEGLGLLHPATRDHVLRTTGAPRAVIPGLDLHFVPGRVGYDEDAGEAYFFVQVKSDAAGTESIRCCVEKDALEAAFGQGPLDRDGCIAMLRQQQSIIQQAARARYLQHPVGFDHEILLTRADLNAAARKR